MYSIIRIDQCKWFDTPTMYMPGKTLAICSKGGMSDDWSISPVVISRSNLSTASRAGESLEVIRARGEERSSNNSPSDCHFQNVHIILSSGWTVAHVKRSSYIVSGRASHWNVFSALIRIALTCKSWLDVGSTDDCRKSEADMLASASSEFRLMSPTPATPCIKPKPLWRMLW